MIAAQPFLGLAGKLFVALETPWWSPISDHTWDWPIGSLEYALPGEFGFGTEVDYVFGSGKPPAISLKNVDFNPDRFAGDLMDDKVPKGTPGPKDKRGSWKEKLQAPPAPPPQPPKLVDSKGKRSPKNLTPVMNEGREFAAGVKALDALRARAAARPLFSGEVLAEFDAIRRRYRFTALNTRPAGVARWEVSASRGKLTMPKPMTINVSPEAARPPAAAARAIAPVMSQRGSPAPPLRVDDRLALADGPHELMTEGNAADLVLRSSPVLLRTVTGGNLPNLYSNYETAVTNYRSSLAVFDDPQQSLERGGTTGQAPARARLGKAAVDRAVKEIEEWIKQNGVPPTDAPGLGLTLPYGSQHRRFAGTPLWRLEAEHVIPRGYFDGLLDGMRLPPTTPTEYGQMYTLLIYERAAEWKTSGGGGGRPEGDLAVIAHIKTWARTYFAELHAEAGGGSAEEAIRHMVSDFEKRIGDVRGRMLRWIEVEQRLNGTHRGHPAGASMRDFFEPRAEEVMRRQLAFFEELLEDRIARAARRGRTGW